METMQHTVNRMQCGEDTKRETEWVLRRGAAHE